MSIGYKAGFVPPIVLDIVDQVDSNLLETFWYIHTLSFVMETIILIKLNHFKIGSINPSRCSMFPIEFHCMVIVPWDFKTILVLWGQSK